MSNAMVIEKPLIIFLILLCTCRAFLGLGEGECLHCDACSWLPGYPVHPDVISGDEELRSPVSSLQHVLYKVKTKSFLFLRKQLGHKLWFYRASTQIILEKFMLNLCWFQWFEQFFWPIVNPDLKIVKLWFSMIKVRSSLMISALRIVDGIPERWLFSAEIRVSSNPLYHPPYHSWTL